MNSIDMVVNFFKQGGAFLYPIAAVFALLLLGGRIADFWGRKRSVLVGMGDTFNILSQSRWTDLQRATAGENFGDLGVALSIDDVGTGDSSRSYLKRFPISTLTIARSFGQDIPGDDEDVAFAQRIWAGKSP